MSKNKFRLTKKKIKSNEYTRKVVLKEGLSQVQFYSEGRECQFDDVIRNYNNQVQYKRFKTFKNGARKNIYMKLIKPTNQDYKHYMNRYSNDIPYSITIHEKEDNKKELILQSILEKYTKNEYELFIEEEYKSLMSFFTDAYYKKNFNKEFNKSKFITALVENKLAMQKEYVNHIQQEVDVQENYLKLYVTKHVTNRIKKELRLKCDSEKIKNKKDLKKEVQTIEFRRIYQYMENKLRMNLIDKNKITYMKNGQITSVDLENLRQEEIIVKKLSESISRASTMITKDKYYKIKKYKYESFDIFGENNSLKRLTEITTDDNKKDKFFRIKKNNKEYQDYIYNMLMENWNKDKEDEVDKVLNAIVEIRSFMVHKKQKLNDDNLKIHYDIDVDILKYNGAIFEKYLTNNVFKYYDFNEVKNIFLQSISLDFEFVELNYFPRFSKILSRLKFDGLFDFEHGDEQKIAINFLYKEFYYNKFREHLSNKKLDIHVMAKVLTKYKESNENLELNQAFEHNEHHIEYKKVSVEVSSGNLEEIQTIWEMYISHMFINYVDSNYTFNKKKTTREVEIEILKKNLNEVVNTFVLNEKNNKLVVFAYIAKLLTRREINELMNSFKSLWQYLKTENVSSVIWDKDEIKTIFNILTINKEIIGRNTSILEKNSAKILDENEIGILNNLLVNNNNIKYYKDEINKIDFKSLRMIQ